jgi:adenine-specific DNA methylase
MIERWFPCAEVTANAKSGWGSGRSEKTLFTWFAARPLVQAKAAVICSLLRWPDGKANQDRLCALVRRAMEGRDAAHDELVAELALQHPGGASLLDSFSGRAMIPLEAARLGVKAWGIDYSPVATLAGTLLADYPLRDWSGEPPLPFDGYEQWAAEHFTEPRLLRDVGFVLNLIGDRYEAAMDEFYPVVDGRRPWGYLWAVTVPCVSCGLRFPLTGSLELRRPDAKRGDLGQSYRIVADTAGGTFAAEVHDGPPTAPATLVKARGSGRGRAAVCVFCDHVHPFDVHTRLMGDGHAADALLVVADRDERTRTRYRAPLEREFAAAEAAGAALAGEPDFAPGLPAVPDERAAGTIGGRAYDRYGYGTFGDCCNARQTLGLVRLARTINDVAAEMNGAVSSDYVAALCATSGANLVRRLKRSTRGASLQIPEQAASHIFTNGPPVPFGCDYLETGCGGGPGTWRSLASQTCSALRTQVERLPGVAANIQRGNAVGLPVPDGTITAAVTDPPYDAMVEYSDGSDILYVWLKRALAGSHPWLGVTAHPDGLQEKTGEAVVKFAGKRSGDHRTPEHYDRCITGAFAEARRVVAAGGVVTIMFGHDDPEVWQRLLGAIREAGLVLTGSWPARTESGSQMGKVNIETTLTLACRPAAVERPVGRVVEVDAEVRREIAGRVPLWEEAGLALPDQRMAAYGPAMEVVGRYSSVLDKTGRPVDLARYLPLARRITQEIAAIRIDGLPLESFDVPSMFALSWARQNRRRPAPGSELRWERLTHHLEESATAGLVVKDGKGFRLAYAAEAAPQASAESPVIDVVFAVAEAGRSVSAVAEVLAATGRAEDPFVWAAMSELADLLGEADDDGAVWTWVVRNRAAVTSGSQAVEAGLTRRAGERAAQRAQQELFDRSIGA